MAKIRGPWDTKVTDLDELLGRLKGLQRYDTADDSPVNYYLEPSRSGEYVEWGDIKAIIDDIEGAL